MDKIEHIGIAVKSLREASSLYERLLGYKSYKTEEIASEQVITEFFKVGESKIELLEASSDESSIHGFIEKRGEGIHHIAFAVEHLFNGDFISRGVQIPVSSEFYKPLLQDLRNYGISFVETIEEL